MAPLSARLRNAVKALSGVSVYTPPPQTGAVPEETIDALRGFYGGNLQRPATTKTQWFLADLEEASHLADQGDIAGIVRLWKASRTDGIIGGLRETRTAGLVALPKQFRGYAPAVKALSADDNGTSSVFDEMFPPSELALLADDGLGPGAGIAEMVPVIGRPHPVMVRLDPEFLIYRFNDGHWYYRSSAGLLPIDPGNGRWILHTPGGRLAPWQGGVWRAVGRAFIVKEHAILHRQNFSGKLANPARVVFAPNAATESQRVGFFTSILKWGLNTVLELTPGWDAKLLESNGRGWEVFGKEIENSDLESMIALAGQVVTVTGGTGFANAGIHETIRADLIQRTGDALAHTINTQGIPPWEAQLYGEEALKNTARMAWNTARPTDRKAEGDSLTGAAKAIKELRDVLAEQGIALDVNELVARFGVPTTKEPKAVAAALEAAKASATKPEGDPEAPPEKDPEDAPAE
jgi:hypothetical protein